ncbi:MAG: hypothetical protein R3B46_11950 [Phycisphaerales bacterium]
MLVNAVPTQFIRSVWARLASHCPHALPVVSVAKGIENDTLLRPLLQVITDVLRDDPDRAACPMLVLSGPTIAAELPRCLRHHDRRLRQRALSRPPSSNSSPPRGCASIQATTRSASRSPVP